MMSATLLVFSLYLKITYVKQKNTNLDSFKKQNQKKKENKQTKNPLKSVE